MQRPIWTDNSVVMKRGRTATAGAALAAIALIAGAAPGTAAEGTPRAAGAGVDTHGLEFEFRAKRPNNPSGHGFFETNSFGSVEGDVDCLVIDRRHTALAGEISNPGPSGLTHWMIIANDRRRGGEIRDWIVTWLRNGPFDCATDGFGDLAQSLARIESGRVRIVR